MLIVQLDHLMALEMRHLRKLWKTEHETGKLNYGIIFISCIFSYVLSIVFNAVLMRHLSMNNYADFTIAYRSLNFVSLLLLFGSNMTAQKYVPVYASEKDSSNMVSFLKWNFFFVLKVSAIFFLLYLCAITAITYEFLQGRGDGLFYYILVTIAISPIYSYFYLFTSLINSIGHGVLSSMIKTVFSQSVMLIIFCVGLTFANTVTKFDLSGLLQIYVLVLFFSSFICYYSLKNNYIRNAFFYKHRDISKEKCREWEKVSSVYLVNNMIYFLILTADIFILKFFTGSAKAVTIYNISVVINHLFYLVNTRLDTYLLPDLSIFIKKRSDSTSVQKKINIVNAICLLSLIAFCLVFLFFGSSLFALFKIKDEGYSSLLILVCLSNYANLLSYMPFFTLSDLGYYSFLTKVNCLNLFLMVFLGSILVTFYGAYGIAMASLIARAITFVIVFSKVSYLTSLRFLSV